ncbi:acyl-CoA thioesterase [Rheinheimera baltica]|uniref:Acyl-CoA thioesterase n=1 Tax=Rheinheimera baltica TaxID=67576 RepID=A0ABT9HXQ7_9GAMM|nr:acyl-CoA thioesterase [Rheinheimera baltica]MDP5135753.1 acyl-CoA thioesterase [Rheinheimera baltica]
MSDLYRKGNTSRVTLSQLMLPSHSNFSGKIHGGHLLSLMDQIAFASGSKFSGKYCVTASVDRVDFLNPIEVGELVTLKASVIFVGNSSMVVGIRVEAQNIQTGKVKHCNSSYFTMIAKDEQGNNVRVPRLILTSKEEILRFVKTTQRLKLRHNYAELCADFDGDMHQAIHNIQQHFEVKFELPS